MLVVISRTSDSFMDCDLPSKSWPPHPDAIWSERLGQWVIEIDNFEDLIALCYKKNVRLLVEKYGDTPYVEIDDYTNCNIGE
jgi:hypothetical protein